MRGRPTWWRICRTRSSAPGSNAWKTLHQPRALAAFSPDMSEQVKELKR